MKTPGPVPRTLLVASAALLAVRILAGLSFSNWLWGVAPERYWPAAGRLALVLLAGIGFLPAIGRPIERRLDRLGGAWERRAVSGDLALAALMGLLFLLLRDPTRFTGDSSLREGILTLPAGATARLMAYYFPLDRLCNVTLPRLLSQLGMSPATGLQLVGAVLGAAFVFVSMRFLHAAGARRMGLSLAALTLLGAGTLPHFAGYDKLGPLMLGLALAALGAMRLARTGHGIVALVAGAAIAVLAHRSGYLVMPAVAWALGAAFRSARDGKRRVEVALALVCVAVPSAVMVSKAVSVARSLDLATHLPGASVAGARVATGALAPLLHLADALNVIWFLVPVWLPVGLAVWRPAWRVGIAAALTPGATRGTSSKRPPREAIALAPVAWLALLPTVALVFAVSPGGGWARDWDVALGAGVLVGLATAYALTACAGHGGSPGGGLAGGAAPIATMALSAAIALWGVHANERIGLRRIEALLEGRPAMSDATRAQAYSLLGERDLTAGKSERAILWLNRAIACAPNPRFFHELGLALETSGRLAAADSSYARAGTLSAGVADSWVGRARVALALGDSAGALAFADSALVRNPGEPEAGRIRAGLGVARSPLNR